jgi:hypothetical protein
VHPDLQSVATDLAATDKPVVFFVGAGLSKELGLPLWAELFEDLVSYGCDLEVLDESMAKRARSLVAARRFLACGDLLRREMEERVDDRLEEIFSRQLPVDLGIYEFLVRLPCAGFVTTNYDAALEEAYVKHFRRPLYVARSEDQKSLGKMSIVRPFLLRLHGDAAHRHFVLSRSDYNALRGNDQLRRALQSLYLYHRVVFVGYGMADEQLLAPLEHLVQDYRQATRRHVALLPKPVDDDDRRRLDHDFRIGVAGYEADEGHTAVSEVIMRWWIDGAKRKREVPLAEPTDYAAVLRRAPGLLAPEWLAHAQHAVEWLLRAPQQWGRHPDDEVKAANLAEALIAFGTADGVVSFSWDPADIARRLLEFRFGGDHILSATLGKAMVQTNALSVIALAEMAQRDITVEAEVSGIVAWLEAAQISDAPGWGWEPEDVEVHTVSTIVTLAALHSVGRFPWDIWTALREKLVASGVIGLTLDEGGASHTAAGWLLWLAASLRDDAQWSAPDGDVVKLALQQLSDPRDVYTPEYDSVRHHLGGSQVGFVAWIHPTAPAVCIGALGWMDEDPAALIPLSNALATLERQFDPQREHHIPVAGQENFVPYAMYAVWALAAALHKFQPRGRP